MPDKFLQRLSQARERISRIKDFWAQLEGDGKRDELTLEIGCGHGHWLTAYAERNPKKLCIGIDLITKRIELAKKKKEKRKLPLLHFMKAEAIEFLEGMGESSKLIETILLFPDPWPKKRHHKRRLLNKAFLDLLADRTVAGGKMYFRTDYEEYFDWTAEKVENHASWTVATAQSWPFEHETYFQNILPNHKSLTAKRSQTIDYQRQEVT